ncbi:putative ripening-related protein 5 [Panicum miliaceum]|uniref:Ripening-related protein 5 n=1 Tax=Panicum miliaceum TaxID=4540 RepID=A0A3L6RMU4_PANMI|nr:putative ripening-related protein 5 [Panicum miliaceum]
MDHDKDVKILLEHGADCLFTHTASQKATIKATNAPDGPSECDNSYQRDGEMVVTLSTSWFSNMARCGHRIKITANGNSVYAKVVNECDSVHGCDDDHKFEAPCTNNIIDALPAVWNVPGLDQSTGEQDITWSDGDE